jgi:hypothetical protein
MKLKNTMLLVAAVGMTTMIQTAQASYDWGTTATLAQLENIGGTAATSGGYLTIGDKTFSNFSSLATTLFDGSGQPANITVTASQVGSTYLLTWVGEVATIAGGGNDLGDLKLGYSVTATDGKIFAIDQSYTGTANPLPGEVSIAENVYHPGTVSNPVASSQLTQFITGTGYTAVGAILQPALPSVDVVKDIQLISPSGDAVSISVVEQSFEQVPEASTILAGALLLLPLGASTLRILRKSPVA